jgi:acyl-CoA thioesterase-1
MQSSLQTIFIVLILITTLISAACENTFDNNFFDDDDDINYFALGASDVLGVGATSPNRGYVFRIQDELEEEFEEDVDLSRVAAIGATVDEIEERLRPFLAVIGGPDLTTIWTGPNDVIDGDDPAEFEADLRDILSLLRAETSIDAVIAIANIPDLTQLPFFIENPDPDVTLERIMAFNDVIESLAAEFGVPVVDLFSEPITDDLVAKDDFHPSDEGHQRIAELFLEVILSELGISPSPSPSISPSPFPSPSP